MDRGDSRGRQQPTQRGDWSQGGRPPSKRPDVAAAVRNGLTKEFIDVVEHFAENLEASSSQLRNVFSFIKQLQAREFDPEDLLMLRPRLAYAATRERKLQDLRDVLSPAIDAVAEVGGEEAKSRFERFCRCCEAIIAYAKR